MGSVAVAVTVAAVMIAPVVVMVAIIAGAVAIAAGKGDCGQRQCAGEPKGTHMLTPF
jgi:hypothetical protein